ncbi:DUF3011 domain-containing protein [Stenotrophomonas sp. SY1]|uniref:DUF3011 domain-containing protein n=1 Tax=Stenotrophomonas sp. SY1 TaxID=477235 RepID=UPI001E5189A0|nr:DUF3011 domain-containing protein [Stenotrophomonas sp. SY1]MCD9085207.1 DUF3011 domain-containing protein [Stenotrophomonas sp. SY1]
MEKMPFLFTTTVALFAGLSMVPQASAAIPMFNGTCPGNLEIHADQGGLVYVNGQETRLKRFNDDYYEASDSISGVTLSITRSPDDETQVSYADKHGANGVCTVGAIRPARTASAGGDAREVTCESVGNGQTECDMDTRGDVRLVRQLSHTECVQNENWGLSRHSVWVKDGCRAVFSNADRGHSGHSSYRPAAAVGMGVAGELLGACNVRANADGALVTRVPVNDQVTELIIDYPDGRFLCMVRNDGLVQSLTRIRGK